MDEPVPPVMEDGLHLVPQERVLKCTPEQLVDVPVPRITEAIVVNRFPATVENRVGERIVDSPVPQIMEDSLPFVPQERVQNRTLEQIVGVPVPQRIEAPVDVLPTKPQERVLNRTLEQIVGVPVPQLIEAPVDVLLIPQESVQNRMQEQIVGFPVPQIVQESVQNCTLEQVSVSPVPQIMEAVVEVFPPPPQVRVQSRIQEQIMDLPVPQIMPALKPYNGKLFTVEMPHLHVHQAYPGDYVVFNIRGLDKHNMPRSGDVMVPASQIQEQIVDVCGTGIVREILEEQVVERIQDSAAFGGTEHDQQVTPAGDGRHASSSSVQWRPELHPSLRQTVARDGSVYFWHVHTRQTQWDPPKNDEGEDEHFDTENVEEDDARGIGSRFHGSFRPMRLCRVFGAGCCWRGA